MYVWGRFRITTVVLDTLSEFCAQGKEDTLDGDRGVARDGLAFRLLATLPGGDRDAAKAAAIMSCSMGSRTAGDREGPGDDGPTNWPGGAVGDQVGPDEDGSSGLEA